MMVGTIARMRTAMRSSDLVPVMVENQARLSAIVHLLATLGRVNGHRHDFHLATNENRASSESAGRARGRMTLLEIRSVDGLSILAASSN